MCNGKSTTLSDLAVHLDVSEKLLVQMLVNLVHQGYVRQFDVGTHRGGCAGCSLAMSSEPDTKFRGWELTETGMIAANVM
jgi:DNA-binding IscR family transcriptional regulator